MLTHTYLWMSAPRYIHNTSLDGVHLDTHTHNTSLDGVHLDAHTLISLDVVHLDTYKQGMDKASA